MDDSDASFLLAGSELHSRARWHCEPRRWSVTPLERAMRIEPDAPTDFWRKTHYGFEADNGHFLGAEVDGDFTLTALVTYRPVHQYDQAGLMVRLSPTCWLKTSVEYELDEPGRLGVVVTNNGYSDWSTQDVAPGGGRIWLRVRRQANDYFVESSWDGSTWQQLRMTHLEDAQSTAVMAGVYACSPKGAGFVAEFSGVTMTR
ncbi:MAG: DUF1349 domain-containing protein [Planctomycetota bacterium]|nr:MAG: DUF1349 domain-containing protein [Planctomycetota bacterium]